MAKSKVVAFFVPLVAMVAGGAVGWFAGAWLLGWLVIKVTGLVFGAFIGLVVGGMFVAEPEKERVCEICGAAIIRAAYQGVINGKHFDLICPKCNNHVRSKKRREVMKDLVG